MSTAPKRMTRFTTGISEDGSHVSLHVGLAGGEEAGFAIPRDRISWLIAKLVEATKQAAVKAGWKPQRIAGRDDKGIWMQPTQVGLVDGGIPERVFAVIEVGPTRFRFALQRSHALELGQALQAAAAPQGKPN